jgi:hypothetical protein
MLRTLKSIKPDSTRPQDYPSTLSDSDREDLAARAKLKAERKKKKKLKRS